MRQWAKVSRLSSPDSTRPFPAMSVNGGEVTRSATSALVVSIIRPLAPMEGWTASLRAMPADPKAPPGSSTGVETGPTVIGPLMRGVGVFDYGVRGVGVFDYGGGSEGSDPFNNVTAGARPAFPVV